MKIPQFEGIINVITTPFDSDNAIDYDVLEQHIEFVIAGGVHAILPGGSTGEYYAQSFPERRRVLEFVADKVRGRVPLYAGVTLPLIYLLENGCKYIQYVKFGCELAGIPVGSVRPPMGGLTTEEKGEFRRLYDDLKAARIAA
jgi:4-hydroxy-tetrahydrodipicolinate synthase